MSQRAAGISSRPRVFPYALCHASGIRIASALPPAAVVAATLAVGRAILLESAMSFFGVGVQPPQPGLGNMLYQAQTSMSTEPWLAVFPVVFIFVTVLCVYVVGAELGADELR